MSEQTSTIVSKVWGMCGPLRDDGVSYGDYLEQITYMIFLKMADEYAKPPYKRNLGIPAVKGLLPPVCPKPAGRARTWDRISPPPGHR